VTGCADHCLPDLARRLFIGGLVLFTVASIACAFASNLWLFIAARGAQGFGGAVIMALGIALRRLIGRSFLLFYASLGAFRIAGEKARTFDAAPQRPL